MISTNKWMKAMAFAISVGFLVGGSSCKKDEPSLDDPPSDADAQFTYQASSTSDNIIEFTAANPNYTNQWDFGNGTTAEGHMVTAEYPNAGDYTVVLTVYNSGGSNSSSQVINIAEDDPGLLDNPLSDLLTGGSDGPGSKTWAVDSAAAGHFGVGPNPSQNGDWPEWYSAGANEKAGAGFYNDRFVFHLSGFRFDQVTNGDIYLNTGSLGDWPNAVETGVGDYMSPFPDQLNESWNIVEGADTTITVSGQSFIGYYTGVQTYRVLNIEENQLYLRYEDQADPGLAWYIRLIPEGFNTDTGTPPPPPTASLPLDFVSFEPDWTTFGNNAYTYVDNPDQSGINTSMRVLETTKGNEGWAGQYVDLVDPLDFSTQTTIKLKVWAPATGTFRMKLEEQADANSFVELDATVTTANAWEEITFDFVGSANIFDRLVIFPSWDVGSGGVFYVDDIVQQ